MPALKKTILIFCLSIFTAGCLIASESSSKIYSHFLNAQILEKNGQLDRALIEYNRSLELAPEAGEIFRERANLHMKMGNPEQALTDVQVYVRLHPEDRESLKILANIHLMRGQSQAARRVMERILELDPQDSKTLMDLALLLMTEDPPASVKVLEKLTALEPEFAETFYHLGLAYQKNGEESKSEAAFKKVVELDPSSLPSLFLLGQMSEKAGKLPQAIRYYETALEKMPENLSLRMQLILLHTSRSNLFAIERLLDYYKDDPQAPVEAHLWLGVVAESRKNWDVSLDYYLRAQKQAETPEILVRLASIYSHLGKMKETLRSLKTLIRKNPENAQYRYFLGLAYIDLQKPKKAIKEFEKAAALNPKISAVHFQIGVAYDQMNNWALALPAFQEAIRIDAANASAYNYIGYTLADRSEDLVLARRMIERALNLEPKNTAFIDSLGWLNYREGNYESAVAHLTAAAAQMTDPIILDHLGDAQKALGKIGEAALSYSKSLEVEPKNRKVKKKLDVLNRFLVPTSPARKILKAFEYRLRQAANISGPFFVRGNFALASRNISQGVFYLRQNNAALSSESPRAGVPRTEMRVDLKNSAMMPPVILRYRSLQPALSVFPPEFKNQIPQGTSLALETVASFLNGNILSQMDGPATTVEETSRRFILTREDRGGRQIVLNKKNGTVERIVTPDCQIDILGYKNLGDISLPETLSFILDGQKFEIRFTTLSLDKIENKIFSEDTRSR